MPLGLVAGLLAGDGSRTAESGQLAREALIRLEPRFGGAAPAGPALRSWAGESAAVVAGMLQDPAERGNGQALLARADELLAASRADALADGSDLLPSGLTRRLASLAGALRAAVAGVPRGGPRPAADSRPTPWPASSRPGPGWPPTGSRTATRGRAAFHAAVRLARWLAGNSAVGQVSLQALAGRHGDSDAWVDSAVGDAAPGVSDPDLGAGLAAVLAAVRARRAAHDMAFATALAAHTSDDPAAVSGTHAGVRHLEDLLPEVILPLARSAPVLLLVLDGMSAGVGTEVIASVLARTGDGWAEALLPGQSRRAAALAVLPTLTEVSRASLLCGELRAGGQEVERRGYEALTKAYGLRGAALFHKKPLDSSRLGFAVADDVAGGHRRRDRAAAGHLRAEHDRRRAGPFGPGRHGVGRRRGQAPRAAAGPGPARGPDRRADRGPRARGGTPPGHAACPTPISPAAGPARRPSPPVTGRCSSPARGCCGTTGGPSSPSTSSCGTGR